MVESMKMNLLHSSSKQLCVACGEYHGPINELINCLTGYVSNHKVSMARIAELENKAIAYDLIRKLTTDFYALRTSRANESAEDAKLTLQAKARKHR
jgi:hypothetical protein